MNKERPLQGCKVDWWLVGLGSTSSDQWQCSGWRSPPARDNRSSFPLLVTATSWNLNTGHWEPRTSSAPANLTKAACSRYRASELYRYRSTNDRGFTDFIFKIFKLRVFTGQFSYLHLRENILVSQYFQYLHVISCYASIFAK